ncbi:MAG: guanine nucleotide exchange protein for ADP-robosylation factor [Cirrosporium novae-zelandiae]|nr:MAG: guanine nucleotide exchange protein for ADP-robosylation factor [Cirrosporium novae-zelandiae]
MADVMNPPSNEPVPTLDQEMEAENQIAESNEQNNLDNDKPELPIAGSRQALSIENPDNNNTVNEKKLGQEEDEPSDEDSDDTEEDEMPGPSEKDIEASTELQHDVPQEEATSSTIPDPSGKATPEPPEKPSEAESQSSTPPTSEHQSSTEPSSLQTTIPSMSLRPRSDSRSTTATRSTPLSSTVFVVAALDKLAASKEAKKEKEFGDSIQKALSMVKENEPQHLDPEVLFDPLLLASRSFNQDLQNEALDCLGKLISYSYFSLPSASRETSEPGTNGANEAPLIERAIEAICDCFENEATPVRTQQQIIKSLLAAVLNDRIIVHGAGLLKAVRQIYNIFIYSKSSTNQQVAQASLTQMVETVFDRVTNRLSVKEARLQLEKSDEKDASEDNSNGATPELNGTSEVDMSSDAASTMTNEQQSKPGEKLTLQSFENPQNVEDGAIHDNVPTTVSRIKEGRRNTRTSSLSTSEQDDGETPNEDEEDEIYIKDAFLVFRSLCKLSHKVLTPEQQQDIKSQNMRSKLLSLHLIHLVLNNYMVVFTSPFVTLRSNNNSNDPTSFIQAAKPHLCLSLSRNGSSSIKQVFEICCETFWLLLKDLRVSLKKELEVFLKEIYLSILERRNAPSFQKQYFMTILQRLSGDPRALVEIYLNYDCDRTALDNIFQGTIEHLSKICSTSAAVTPIQQQQYLEQRQKISDSGSESHYSGTFLPTFTTANMHHPPVHPPTVPIEYALKQEALECLVEALRSLDNWSRQPMADGPMSSRDVLSRNSVDDVRQSVDGNHGPVPPSPRFPPSEIFTNPSTPLAEDDPAQLEKAKQKKTALAEGIRLFNFKAKRGIKKLLDDGFIHSDTPEDIAVFLLSNDRLDKAMIGEYLGEGEPKNVAIMHSFVDGMNFTKRRFVDALRQFLQSFRLPGEAQKIDRFMLKFAERYMAGNPNAFANADTAYVLAYSVILLNTDQHSTKMKGRRMTKEDFVKNNRGINDNADLPEEYLGGIFDEIAQHEIVLNTERENAAALGLPTEPPPTLASRMGQGLLGRDPKREQYNQASEEMATKTENLYRSLIRAQRKTASKKELSKFIPASSFRHVGPMFEVTWMSFLSALSGQVQDTQNLDTIKLCMEGLKLCIRISCLFDLEMPRSAFVSALSKFTNLGNPREMVAKNVEALRALLEIAATEGNLLKSSWRDILTCISRLDRFQLLAEGVDEGSLPDVSKARLSAPSRADSPGLRKSLSMRARARSSIQPGSFQSDIAQESRSTEMIKGVDWIFTSTASLSPEAIIDFIRALSEVSWSEIQSSGNSESPRMYSLQKLVEISYYNMTRVKIEWTKIWDVLGEHFNQVGCHTNTHVVFFALDSLRQLSMRFMELEELPGFKFQKDFLKPFEHVMANTNVVTVKDMVLRCLHQMIQARGENIRSGWKTMFGVFTVAAREPYEGIVNLAYDHVMQVYNTRFGSVISQGAFADLVVCLTEFSKNLKFQKKALQAIEVLRSTVHKMLTTPECPLSHRKRGIPAAEIQTGSVQPNSQTQEEQFWFPILFAFHDILMTGDDLEVRGRALSYLFETLKQYGGDFPPEFWDTLWRQLLYPIFMVLRSKSEMSKVLNHEELSVWLSTTMVQALREMITLFTYFYDSLEYMLDRFLELLTLCICQENDTIARIGSNCLQQLILNNVDKFESRHWTQIVTAFVELFEKTTAHQLFTAASATPPAKTSIHSDAASVTDLQIDSPPPESFLTPAVENPLRINGLQSPSEPAGEPTAGDDTPKAGSRKNSSASQQPTSDLEDYRPQPEIQQQPVVVTAARRRFFNKIITKCVLQLLMIETVQELFSNDAVYSRIPSPELLRLMSLLKSSYMFAKKFNDDRDLRQRLYLQGFMKQAPNLLKQESGSAATYVNILLRMYHDENSERKASRAETEDALVPLCADIIRSYVLLDEEKQQRNIMAWRPVVVDVIEGYTNFPKDGFDKHIETFYPLGVELLGRDMGTDVRFALQGMLRRIGEARMGMAPLLMATPLQTPTSPRSSSSGYPFGSRRTSYASSISRR